VVTTIAKLQAVIMCEKAPFSSLCGKLVKKY